MIYSYDKLITTLIDEEILPVAKKSKSLTYVFLPKVRNVVVYTLIIISTFIELSRVKANVKKILIVVDHYEIIHVSMCRLLFCLETTVTMSEESGRRKIHGGHKASTTKIIHKVNETIDAGKDDPSAESEI